MKLIQVVYSAGSNGLVNVMRAAHKNRKRLCEMSSEEITKTCFGLFR